jgi:Domain of unknown function (DUF4129)
VVAGCALPTLLTLPTRVPVDLGRDEGRAAAARELLKPIYHRDDPTLYERVQRWIGDLLARLLVRAVQVAPGGPWGVFVFVIVVAAIVALAVWRRGAVARTGSRPELALFGDDDRSADEMRAEADRAAAAADWVRAVQERFRAVVRGLEERTIIDRRPGWTADEAAAAAGRSLPELAGELMAGARLFDEVTYGRRPADAGLHDRVQALDGAARRASPRRAAAAAGAPLAAPR